MRATLQPAAPAGRVAAGDLVPAVLAGLQPLAAAVRAEVGPEVLPALAAGPAAEAVAQGQAVEWQEALEAAVLRVPAELVAVHLALEILNAQAAGFASGTPALTRSGSARPAAVMRNARRSRA